MRRVDEERRRAITTRISKYGSLINVSSIMLVSKPQSLVSMIFLTSSPILYRTDSALIVYTIENFQFDVN